MSKSELTIPKVLQVLAIELDRPVSVAEICNLIKSRWSVQYAINSVRTSLRWEGVRLGWVKLNRKHYLPLRLVLDGLRFRCWPRPQDIATGRLPIAHLRPFAVFRRQSWPLIYDEQGNMLSVEEPRPHTTGFAAQPVVAMQQWFQRHNFAAGDSILVEVRYCTQLELHVSYEPAAAFRADAVTAQDRELLSAIVERVNEGLRACEDIILPIFANASWRTGYPGRPWQYLVLADRRLTLIEDALIEPSTPLLDFRRGLIPKTSPDDVIFHPSLMAAHTSLPVEQAVLDEIMALQQAMQQSREQDRRAGLWNGELARKSCQADIDDDDTLAVADEMFEPFARTDEVARALQRMQEVLPPDVQQRWAQASPEEAEVILSSHLNYLLVKAPDLFPKLDLRTTRMSSDTSLDQRSTDFELLLSDDSIVDDDDDWNDDLFTDWDDDWDDDDEEDEDAVFLAASAQSDSLVAQYCDYLQEMGKRRSTALFQTRLLKPYAQFLASFYYQSLDQGNYATLDEFLFYYYPYHNNVSERYIREMCSALKHFYTFLRNRGVIQDDRFARAIWKRRDQAARLIALYQRIERDYPDQEQLIHMLFIPYVS
ncbi:MAG: hypothetical protein K6356_00455 [Chloroflexus sp.]